jgi:cytochrome P450
MITTMEEQQLERQASKMSSLTSQPNNDNNRRMIIAVFLTLIAFLTEVYNGKYTTSQQWKNYYHLFSSNSNASSSSSSSSHFLPIVVITILLIITLLLSISLYIHNLKCKIRHSSIPGLPHNPNAHILIGHYGHIVNPEKHLDIFHTHATPSGISSLWGPGLKVCASILKAEHARLILRHTSSRDFSSFIARHGRKTLGKDSLILIEGGVQWKRVRTVVSKAFTIGAIQSGRGAVGECAVAMVRWLLSACSNEGGGCHGHKCVQDAQSSKERRMICLDVEDFFKIFSLDVFGRVTMDYDFQSLKKATMQQSVAVATNSPNNNDNNGTNSNNSQQTCTCLTSPPEAEAFQYLERDVGIRAHPKHLINPFIQFYWMPTPQNREYYQKLTLVNGLMGNIIGMKLDEFLSSRHTSSSSDNPLNHRMNDDDSDGGEDNMITMLLRSVIEQHYHPEKDQKKKQKNTPNQMNGCPFTSSSSSRTFSSSLNGLSEPDTTSSIPSTISQSDRKQIIIKVTQILHTLLVAGYETTAISLSYTMYCLSKNPRCQDRACEEARRVLSTLDEHTKFDEDALPYCKAIIMESVRLHVPVIFTTRVASKDLVLDTDDEGGVVTIPKGTRFLINPTMIHRYEKNFDRAEDFCPERWVKWENGGWVERDHEEEKLESKNASSSSSSSPPPSLSNKYTAENAHADTISAANPLNFFAFSDGARNCIGRRLAIMEMTIFVAVLFRDMCVDLAEKDYKLVKERRFVILAPKRLPIAFWKRDD